jgi:hypothetical protein
MTALRLALGLVAFLLGSAHAKELSCHVDEVTRGTMCIDESNVTANGDVRASPVFMGGPKGVDRTAFFLVVNCQRSVITLQDRKGVNFAGDKAGATKASRALSEWVCAAPRTKRDPTLRQFGS